MNLHRTVLIAAAAGLAAPATADFETDFGVAWDGVGQLQVEFNFGSIEPISNFIAGGGLNGDFTGFFSDEPGFANFEEDEPLEDLFVVPDGTVVGFQLVSADAAFVVYDLTFDSIVNPGDTIELGAVLRDGTGAVTLGFDDHPWWTVDTTDPSYDPSVTAYSMTFRLVDLRTDGNAIAATDDITVSFPIPAPGSAALLGLAGLAAARRRR
ncbi:MAG: hypothetical protein AAGB48_02635 [Planctomycetota bacterium]